jgi:hypothetical protein
MSSCAGPVDYSIVVADCRFKLVMAVRVCLAFRRQLKRINSGILAGSKDEVWSFSDAFELVLPTLQALRAVDGPV